MATSSIPQPANNEQHFSVQDLCFSPLRFCGRQWMWVADGSKSQLSQIALKILAAPFLSCATVLAFLPAACGALVFTPKIDHSYKHNKISQDHKDFFYFLIDRHGEDNVIKTLLTNNLNQKQSICSVTTCKLGRPSNNTTWRQITLKTSSSPIASFMQVIKDHFYNTTRSLNNLHHCIRTGNIEHLPDLWRVLTVHKAIYFNIASDGATISTNLGLPPPPPK